MRDPHSTDCDCGKRGNHYDLFGADLCNACAVAAFNEQTKFYLAQLQQAEALSNRRQREIERLNAIVLDLRLERFKVACG